MVSDPGLPSRSTTARAILGATIESMPHEPSERTRIWETGCLVLGPVVGKMRIVPTLMNVVSVTVCGT